MSKAYSLLPGGIATSSGMLWKGGLTPINALARPRPKRALPLPVEPGDLAEDDRQDLLSQVSRLILEPRNATEPALNQGQIDPLAAGPNLKVRAVPP